MDLFPSARGDAPPRGTSDVLEGYSNLPWLRAVTGRIAQAIAATDWQLYAVRKPQQRAVKNAFLQRASGAVRRKAINEMVENENADLITEHVMLDLLHNGNPHHTGVQLWRLTSASLDLVGEVFWLFQRNGLGVPAALWPIPPTWILETPVPGRDSYRVNFKGRYAEIPASEILALQDPNPADPYGRGTGLAAALGDELATDEYAAKLVRQFFLEGARPDFMIWPKDAGMGLDPAELKRFTNDWLNRHQGFQRAFRPYMAGQEMGVHEFDKDFNKLQMVELRQFERDTIIQTYGMPPEMLGVLTASNRACYSDDTECLTLDGWKAHDGLTPNDLIATWDDKAQRLVYTKPSKIVRYPYDGMMHHWKTKTVDVMVTPDHRMWTQTQFAGDFEIRRSHELFGKKIQQKWRATGGNIEGGVPEVHIPRVAYAGLGRRGHEPSAEGYRVPSETFAPFLGHFVAEGNLGFKTNGSSGRIGHAVYVHQNVGPSADVMRASMTALGMGAITETTRYPTDQNLALAPCVRYALHNKSLAAWLEQHVGSGARNKRLPREVFGWSAHAQDLLLDALMLGDGSKKQARTKSTAKYAEQFYASASRGLADDVQQLCVQLGYRSSIRHSADMWVVGISSKQHVWVTGSKIGSPRHAQENPASEVPYVGTVWCLEVPSHLFFTRRNGKVALHGNTIEAAEYIFTRWVLTPRLELLRSILQERLVPEFDDRLVLDYVSPVPEDKVRELEAAKVAPYALTVNEWRAMAGQPPVDDGDVYMLPPTLTPVASLDEMPEPMIEEPEPPEMIGAEKPPMPKLEEPAPVKQIDRPVVVEPGMTRADLLEALRGMPAPVVNVTGAPVTVTTPPVEVTLTMPEKSGSRKMTFSRDASGALVGADVKEE